MVRLGNRVGNKSIRDKISIRVKYVNYLKISLLVMAMIVVGTKYAYAVGGDPSSWISNGKTQVMSLISTIAFCVVAWFSVHYLMKKQFIPFIGFLVLAGICLVIVTSPDTTKTIGQAIVDAIFK